jgi:hypothetical protein
MLTPTEQAMAERAENDSRAVQWHFRAAMENEHDRAEFHTKQLYYHLERMGADNAALLSTVAALRGENERLRGALTPSAETKSAYWGEFRFDIEAHDSNGYNYTRVVEVPWCTVKEIMAAIMAQAERTAALGVPE